MPKKVESQSSPSVENSNETSNVLLKTPKQKPKTELLALYIALEAEIRSCVDLDALRLSIVNSTRCLIEYDQALIAEPGLSAPWHVTAGSSISKVDRQTRLIRFIEDWLKRSEAERGKPVLEVTTADLHIDATMMDLDAKAVEFPSAMIVPLKPRHGAPLAYFIALRRSAWRPEHSLLMMPLAGAFGHAWEALLPQSTRSWTAWIGRTYLARAIRAGLLLIMLALFIPVPMSALAPAEIVAASPSLVTAPMDGVIDEVLVQPGAWVEKGATLIRFNTTKLKNDVEIAIKTMKAAEARLFKSRQTALSKQEEQEELSVANAEYEVAKAALKLAKDQLLRGELKSSRSGLAIYSARADLIGKPASTGERLMEIGDPASTELRIDMQVSDAIAMAAGSDVTLYLDGDPMTPVRAKLDRIGYRPILDSEQKLVFRAYAELADHVERRIGLNGTARVSGSITPLWFYLLRRPLSAIRQKLGF